MERHTLATHCQIYNVVQRKYVSQRDHGLYLVNVFDTGQATRVLEYPQHNLAFLLDRFCGFKVSKLVWCKAYLCKMHMHSLSQCIACFSLYLYIVYLLRTYEAWNVLMREDGLPLSQKKLALILIICTPSGTGSHCCLDQSSQVLHTMGLGLVSISHVLLLRSILQRGCLTCVPLLMLPCCHLSHIWRSVSQADKRYQLADWRVRPLTPDMLYYARCDTHFLLYIYDRLKIELQDAGKRVPHSIEIPLPPHGPEVMNAESLNVKCWASQTSFIAFGADILL